MMRVLSTILLIGLLLQPAAAQETTVTVMPEAMRGTTTSSVLVPANQRGTVRFSLVSSTWISSGAAWTFTAQVDRCTEATLSACNATQDAWEPMAGFVTCCGGHSRTGELPSLTVTFDGTRAFYRYTLTPSQSFSWGISATF